MKNPELKPHEKAALDRQREGQHDKQPYAAEVDDRALERAQRDNKPVNPQGEAKGGKARR